MDKRKAANLRVKHSITNALIDLMKEKAYEEISISEITKQAGVSRVSYYRNYDSKDDILTENLGNLIHSLNDTLNSLPSHTPIRRVMTHFFKTIRENMSVFMLLYHAGMDRRIQEALYHLIIASDQFPAMDKRRTYPASLFSGALFSLLVQWYNTDMTENDSELSNIFCQYMDGLL